MAFTNAGGIATLGKPQFDALMNAVIQNLDGALGQVQQIQAFLAAHLDADFTAVTGSGPTGYASGDIATVKSAFSDLDQLRTIYQGSANLSVAKDFRTFAKLIATLVH